MSTSHRFYQRSLSALAIALLAPLTVAQTVTVTTSASTIDIDFFNGTIDDLPGPDGKVTFIEAIIATNHTPGHQTIAFNIPADDWGLQFLYPGCAVIVAGPNGFNATDSVTIDGTTQTAFTGDTNPNGGEVALYFPFGTFGAGLGGDNSVLRGFHAGEWSVWGDNAQVTGNSGGIHINIGGDFALVEDNQAGTIKIDRGNHATVIGNTMQRVRIWGSGETDKAIGNRIGGPTLAERNFITGYGTTNSEGLPSGTDVELFHTQDTIIENNYIGTTPDGMAQGNLFSNIGIAVNAGNIGLRVRDNLLAGVLGHGQGPHWAGTLWGWAVYFQGTGADIEFSGNTIGLDAAGNPTLPSVWGVGADSSTYTDVRFLDNTIAGHYFSGVTVGRDAREMRLAGNAIYGNATSGGGFLGIDLIGSDLTTGVTANDPLDADEGGNGLQNYPTLASASVSETGTTVSGSLDSAPFSDYTIELFASPACDPTGFGQGQLVLGTLAVTTDGLGHAAFTGNVAAAPKDWAVTATATLEPVGATSEFAGCIPTTSETCAPDMGFAGPGTASLTLCGESLGSGQSALLAVQGATPTAPVWLAFGPSFSPTSVFGGTLVPVPGQLLFLGSTDAAGSLDVGSIHGGGGPVTLFAQAAYLDISLPESVGLSNAIQIDLLP